MGAEVGTGMYIANTSDTFHGEGHKVEECDFWAILLTYPDLDDQI